MNLYAESSAILAWLRGEKAGPRISELLGSADFVAASELTLIECDRVLIRDLALGEISDEEADDRRLRLITVSEGWDLLRMTPDIVERARRPFPLEPVRTLDALHLATVLAADSGGGGLELLSLDNRIRSVARRLGMQLQPE